MIIVLIVSLVFLFANSILADDNLVEQMEFEILLNDLSKEAYREAYDLSVEAVGKTSLAARAEEQFSLYRELSNKAAQLYHLSQSFGTRVEGLHDKFGDMLSGKKYGDALNSALVRHRCASLGVTAREGRVSFHPYGYSKNDESCNRRANDITSTTAGYSLCIIHLSYTKSESECEELRLKIERLYPSMKELVESEKDAKEKHREAEIERDRVWDLYQTLSSEVFALRQKFTNKLYYELVEEKLDQLKIKINQQVRRLLEQYYNEEVET